MKGIQRKYKKSDKNDDYKNKIKKFVCYNTKKIWININIFIVKGNE